jgi:simple sugar transport system permease protein
MTTHDLTGSVGLAFLGALITGLFIGWLNGIIVVKFGIPSLVATIGTQFFWRGAVLVLGQGKSGSLVYTKASLVHPVLVGKLFGIVPMQMIWLIVIAAATWVLLNRHKFGAHIYLIGDNVNSAELMGINTGRTRILAFMLVGIVSAFAGVVASLHVTYFWPSLGDGQLLRTLASVFLGGTSVFGGVGTIFGTFLGAFIIGSIEAGTVAIGLTGFWTQLIYGFIIVLSVIMHTYVRRRME